MENRELQIKALNLLHSLLPGPFTCGHRLWVVTEKEKIADTSSPRWGSSTWWLASLYMRKWAVQQTERAPVSSCCAFALTGALAEVVQAVQAWPQNRPRTHRRDYWSGAGRRWRGKEYLGCSVHTVTTKTLTLISALKKQEYRGWLEGWKLRPKGCSKKRKDGGQISFCLDHIYCLCLNCTSI